MIADVKRAYFHAKAKRTTYVQLPPEDIGPGEEGMCGGLNYSMYGTRRAATNWQTHYTSVLEKYGFRVGTTNRCTFYHPTRDIHTIVHGDDFVSTASGANLTW